MHPLLGGCDVASEVDRHRVAKERRCIGWCLARFVHDRDQRVADTVELDYGDTSLTAQGLEPVRVRVGPDGLSEFVHQDVTALPVSSSQGQPIGGLAGLQRAEECHRARMQLLHRDGPVGG